MMLYSLRQLTQHCNQRLVLDIDHLDIETGCLLALLGPNGAGKTTLLNILGFLEKPSSGTLSFQGKIIGSGRKELEALRRQVVLVDQHPIMFTTKVCDNIAFGLKIRAIDRKERERSIDEVLDLVGLSRYRSANAHELSGGETQRLALARALALKPQVLLCDEPTASVDAENQAIIINLLHQINSESGTAILFTTHDRLQAATLAKQTLVLEQGRLADARGENSFACTVGQDAEGRSYCSLRKDLVLPVALPPGQLPGQHPCRILLLPDKIVLQTRAAATQEQTSRRPTLTGSVALVMAEEQWVRVVVNIGVMLVVLMAKEDYRRQRPAVGETVSLFVPAEAITIIA